MGKVCKKLGKLDDAMMRFTFALDLEPKDNNLIKSAIDRLEEPDVSEELLLGARRMVLVVFTLSGGRRGRVRRRNGAV